jgi:phospholipid/cholesterol/gamma-HCH transport system substrate-binding protein
MKRALLAVAATAATLGLTGCTPYTGINSLPLPGTEGTGSDSYQIKVQLHDADDLVANTPVFVNDINVGTTTLVALDGWTPTLTLSLKNSVKLPANATAALAQTSLLGSKHIDLITPPNPQGTLQPGAVITEDKIHQFPETEDLLAGVSVLLNGGGLQHFQTITTELNRALGGTRANDTREFLTQFDNFTAGLDKQSADITYALKSFDHLGQTFGPRMADIDKGIQQLPAGLDTLDDLEPQLLKTTQALTSAAQSFRPFFNDSYDPQPETGTDQLTKLLKDLKDPLRAVGDAQPGSIPRFFRQAPFLIFPLDGIQYLVRGDYARLQAPVNITLDSIDKNVFGGTPLSGSLSSVAEAARGTSKRGPNSPPNSPAMSNPWSGSPLSGRSGLAPRNSGSGPLGGLPKLGN